MRSRDRSSWMPNHWQSGAMVHPHLGHDTPAGHDDAPEVLHLLGEDPVLEVLREAGPEQLAQRLALLRLQFVFLARHIGQLVGHGALDS